MCLRSDMSQSWIDVCLFDLPLVVTTYALFLIATDETPLVCNKQLARGIVVFVATIAMRLAGVTVGSVCCLLSILQHTCPRTWSIVHSVVFRKYDKIGVVYVLCTFWAHFILERPITFTTAGSLLAIAIYVIMVDGSVRMHERRRMTAAHLALDTSLDKIAVAAAA